MKTARLFLIALSLVATINAPLLAGGRVVCRTCVPYSRPYVAPAVVKAAPAVAPNYSTSTSSTDNSVTYNYSINYAQLPAAQGQTLYGYSDRAYTYAVTDLGVDNLISQRLVADASAIQSKVLAGQQANAASAAEIAKLQIKGQIITSALNALADHSSGATETQATFTQNIQAAASAETTSGGTNSTNDSSALVERVAGIFSAKCVSCHGPTRQAGGLDLSNLASLDADAGAKILARITSADPTKRMPLAAGDVPGTPLALGETSVLFQAVGPVE